MTSAWIMGMGTAAPEGSVGQGEALAFAEGLTELGAEGERFRRRMYERSGVDRRASVLLHPGEVTPRTLLLPSDEDGPTTAARLREYERYAAALAERACLGALRTAGVAPGSITHLVTASCTGLSAPGVDVALVSRLGLSRGVARTHIGFMGCHAAINGLRVADALAKAGERVLLCCVELCSLHLRYRPTPDQVVANALFADGAGAAVIAAGDRGSARIRGTSSMIIPETEELMTWTVGDHGFEMRLDARVPEQLREWARPWVERWLGSHGVELGDVGSWCIHPGGPKILSAVAQSLGLGEPALAPSRAVLARHGNMSSPTVLFILHEAMQAAPRSGPAVLMSFGPGLSAEAALVE